MYIHLYTTATSTSSDETRSELHLWWSTHTQEDKALFEDFEHLLQKYKEYGCIATYTGDIMKIQDEKAFLEQLILMGVTIPPDVTAIALQDGSSIPLQHGITSFEEQFNGLFGICLGDYDIQHTFSSDKAPATPKESQGNGLLRIPFLSTVLYTTRIPLQRIAYTTLSLRTEQSAVTKWLHYMTSKKTNTSYDETYAILEKLYKHTNTEEAHASVSGDATAPLAKETSDDRVWVKEFCDLYMEKDEKADTLLSDIYQQYVTASSWTNTDTLGLAAFIKCLKELPQFTVKRKSKGMVVTGYKCLVAHQEALFKNASRGQLCERNLLRYLNEIDIHTIHGAIMKLNLPAITHQADYMAASALLGRAHCTLTKTMLDQFIHNPWNAPSLPQYSEYVQSVLAAHKPLEKSMELFKEVSSKCVLFFPFAKQLYPSHTFMFKTVENTNEAKQPEGYDPMGRFYQSLTGAEAGTNDIHNILAQWNKDDMVKKKIPSSSRNYAPYDV